MLDDVLRAISGRPKGTRLLFLSDYDGTLAEFDPDPAIPRPAKETAELICKLALREDLSFGIVSGRRIADVRTRTQLPGRAYLAGLHGMEIEVGSERWQHPDLNHARQHVRALYERLCDLPGRFAGLVIEDKHASLAVHVRGVVAEVRSDALLEANRRAQPLMATGNLRRMSGNMVLEFLPNVAAHKGDATRWIIKHVENRCRQPVWTVFVGDDVTDEDAFKAITTGIGVLVGRRLTSATHVLTDTHEVCRLLRRLAEGTGIAGAASAAGASGAGPGGAGAGGAGATSVTGGGEAATTNTRLASTSYR
jgi:trehalose 6-phosphate phosphatase